MHLVIYLEIWLQIPLRACVFVNVFVVLYCNIKRIKLSLCLMEHHAMKACGGDER
jgi:hypothetical protein